MQNARLDLKARLTAMFNPLGYVNCEDAEQSRRLGAVVWAEMERHGIAPTPRAYELWFTCRSGVNAQLTLRLTGLLERSETLTPAVLDTLHSEFLAHADISVAALDQGAGEIQRAAQSLAEQVAGSQAAITGYGNTLAHWAQHLGDEPSMGGLIGAVSALTAETTRASERNRALGRVVI